MKTSQQSDISPLLTTYSWTKGLVPNWNPRISNAQAGTFVRHSMLTGVRLCTKTGCTKSKTWAGRSTGCNSRFGAALQQYPHVDDKRKGCHGTSTVSLKVVPEDCRSATAACAAGKLKTDPRSCPAVATLGAVVQWRGNGPEGPRRPDRLWGPLRTIEDLERVAREWEPVRGKRTSWIGMFAAFWFALTWFHLMFSFHLETLESHQTTWRTCTFRRIFLACWRTKRKSATQPRTNPPPPPPTIHLSSTSGLPSLIAN